MLGTALAFDRVPPLLTHFTGVPVSVATVRRLTEAAGAAVPQLSVDGVMVPLVGAVWAEVKTLAVGTVTGARTTALS